MHLGGISPAPALRLAQLEMRDGRRHPAPRGAGEPVELPEAAFATLFGERSEDAQPPPPALETDYRQPVYWAAFTLTGT